ncbi:MAG: thioredoxin domain-containing protein [Dehalococcoidia bacterium]
MTSDPTQPHLNRLSEETSPYLLQHATNPVDWYPWGGEAFARARGEHKPILLSVGYSSCHWCHVMAHESFEDEETAAMMNELFVNVKVDREERPDVDGIYMSAVQAMTGQGGWPMTVFLTPDLEPFFAGTYFPALDSQGRPGFRAVLKTVAAAWERDSGQVSESAAGITRKLREAAERALGDGSELSDELPGRAVDAMAAAFDGEWGGFGNAPKFPQPQSLEFLLAFAARQGSDDEAGRRALGMVRRTLGAMASGGIYDQLGGGFARYSTDREWLVPHFEKMLYDNAQLVRVYLHAFQFTGDETFRRIARETLDYLLRDMRHPEGGFFAAEDADSEGIEGKYYVWSLAEFERLLGREAAFGAACLGVTGAGNFKDPHHPEFDRRNVLTRRFDAAVVGARFDIDPEEIDPRLERLRRSLLDGRADRPRPGLDDKVLASWNGLALAAFAEAGRVLGDAYYLDTAGACAKFLRREMWREGRLLHTWKDGEARVAGLLEDYAYVGLGLVELFKATGDLDHLEWAREISDVIGEEFHDLEGSGFFDASHEAEDLLFRTKEYFDQATPAGNAAAALLLTWLSRYLAEPSYESAAEDTAASASAALSRAPVGMGAMLQVVEFLLAPRTELVLTGDPAERSAFEREVARFYMPWVALAPTADAEGLPMFEGRAAHAGAAAHLCRDMVCDLPASTPEGLREQLTA